jgi:hypothetical protein
VPRKARRQPVEYQAQALRERRAEIARLAARLVVAGDSKDFAGAKRRAAEQLGVFSTRALPTNVELQAAIAHYQSVFEGETAAHRIAQRRRQAVSAMRFFQAFDPRLVGPVFYGTAVAHSPVTLHLYTDEFEGVTRLLSSHRIPYQLGDVSLRTTARLRKSFPTVETHYNDTNFELVVFALVYKAQKPLSPLDGKPYRGMSIARLEQLLATQPLTDSAALT